MAETVRMHENRNINAKHSQYNNVRRENVSVSGIAAATAGRIGDAVVERNRKAKRERINGYTQQNRRIRR